MKCKVCKVDKPKDEFALWGGKVTATCLSCKAEKNGAKKPERAESKPAALDVPRLPGPLEIQIAPSMGFTARVDEGCLVISQANASRENDDDNITLTRTEARQFFDQFEDWVYAK